MAQASISLSRNKFAKRHYEAIALAMQDARRSTALRSVAVRRELPR